MVKNVHPLKKTFIWAICFNINCKTLSTSTNVQCCSFFCFWGIAFFYWWKPTAHIPCGFGLPLYISNYMDVQNHHALKYPEYFVSRICINLESCSSGVTFFACLQKESSTNMTFLSSLLEIKPSWFTLHLTLIWENPW